MDKSKRHLAWWVVGLLAVAAIVAWWLLRPAGVPEGFAVSNGRIEATEVDIASKIAGRIDTILVKEGQFVREGDVLAKYGYSRVAANSDWKPSRKSKRHKAPLPPRRLCWSNAKAKLVPHSRWSINARPNWTPLPNVIRVPARSPNEGLFLRNSWMTTSAAAESARAALESAKAQVSASKAAIEAARTNIIQAQTRVEAAQATERRIAADIDDSELKAPRDGRVQYRVAEPGEVLAAGGRVLNMVDLSDVYMTFFLPTEQAGTLKLGGEARLILDAAPDLRIPATISFVASVAQFTPKTVETSDERLKLMFRVKARIPPELLQQHLEYVKTGLPGHSVGAGE